MYASVLFDTWCLMGQTLFDTWCCDLFPCHSAKKKAGREMCGLRAELLLHAITSPVTFRQNLFDNQLFGVHLL